MIIIEVIGMAILIVVGIGTLANTWRQADLEKRVMDLENWRIEKDRKF